MKKLLALTVLISMFSIMFSQYSLNQSDNNKIIVSSFDYLPGKIRSLIDDISSLDNLDREKLVKFTGVLDSSKEMKTAIIFLVGRNLLIK